MLPNLASSPQLFVLYMYTKSFVCLFSEKIEFKFSAPVVLSTVLGEKCGVSVQHSHIPVSQKYTNGKYFVMILYNKRSIKDNNFIGHH